MSARQVSGDQHLCRASASRLVDLQPGPGGLGHPPLHKVGHSARESNVEQWSGGATQPQHVCCSCSPAVVRRQLLTSLTTSTCMTSGIRSRNGWRRRQTGNSTVPPQLTLVLPMPMHHPHPDDEPGEAPPAGGRLVPGGGQVAAVPGAVVQHLDRAWLLEEGVAATAGPVGDGGRRACLDPPSRGDSARPRRRHEDDVRPTRSGRPDRKRTRRRGRPLRWRA